MNEMRSTYGILAEEAVSESPDTDPTPKREPVSTITIEEILSTQLYDRESKGAREQIEEE